MLINKIKEYFNHVNNVTQIITNDNIEKIISYIKQIPMLCSINVNYLYFSYSGNNNLLNVHYQHKHRL